ncbi:hypothetical protein E4T38_05337 [Aureobasidium subglaciale]|nr:hypothetical protein E4T38_05337 [Aureobasidium subglaciale]KAI5221755.1 hypothetical protein E4T40_05270 [Aureobasidium subglaciale]KAI5225821.1 hypothetical protein E4T41_05089 [Aureobasidium subglaciale]KAI5261591.1 hypothetical protein E4T46_04982 [Aureobasidium subglaciale]
MERTGMSSWITRNEYLFYLSLTDEEEDGIHSGQWKDMGLAEPPAGLFESSMGDIGFVTALASQRSLTTTTIQDQPHNCCGRSHTFPYIEKLIQATRSRCTKQASQSMFPSHTRRPGDPVNNLAGAENSSSMAAPRIGGTQCGPCVQQPSHRLVPCQHTVCYDHYLAHPDGAPARCARCLKIQTVATILDVSAFGSSTVDDLSDVTRCLRLSPTSSSNTVWGSPALVESNFPSVAASVANMRGIVSEPVENQFHMPIEEQGVHTPPLLNENLLGVTNRGVIDHGCSMTGSQQRETHPDVQPDLVQPEQSRRTQAQGNQRQQPMHDRFPSFNPARPAVDNFPEYARRDAANAVQSPIPSARQHPAANVQQPSVAHAQQRSSRGQSDAPYIHGPQPGPFRASHAFRELATPAPEAENTRVEPTRAETLQQFVASQQQFAMQQRLQEQQEQQQQRSADIYQPPAHMQQNFGQMQPTPNMYPQHIGPSQVRYFDPSTDPRLSGVLSPDNMQRPYAVSGVPGMVPLSNYNLAPHVQQPVPFTRGQISNGYNMNGYQPNGYPGGGHFTNTAQMNGHQMNSQQMHPGHFNGPQMNGPQMNGQQMNGQQMNGQQMNGRQMNPGHFNGPPQMNRGQMNFDQMNSGSLNSPPHMNGSHVQSPQAHRPQMSGPQVPGSQMPGSQMPGPQMPGSQMNHPPINMNGQYMGGYQTNGNVPRPRALSPHADPFVDSRSPEDNYASFVSAMENTVNSPIGSPVSNNGNGYTWARSPPQVSNAVDIAQKHKTHAALMAEAIKSGSFEQYDGRSPPGGHGFVGPSSGPEREFALQPFVRSQAVMSPEIMPDPEWIGAHNTTLPTIEDVYDFIPFVNPFDDVHPCTYGVIKIGNIPYGTSKNEVVATLGRSTRITPQPRGTAYFAIHIIMERSTGKTMDCYVEIETPELAEATVNAYRQRLENKRPPRIGERYIDISLSSQEALMTELFPRAKCVEWDGHNPIVHTTDELYNSGFQGFVTAEELVMITKHAETPQRSPFALRCVNRTYEAMISLMHKYPWHAAEHISIRERTDLAVCAIQQLRVLIDAVQRGTYPQQLHRPLLQEYVTACLSNPGFSAQQKAYIANSTAECGFGGMLAYIPYTHVQSPSGQLWVFEVLVKKPEASEQLLHYVMSLMGMATNPKGDFVPKGDAPRDSCLQLPEAGLAAISPFGHFCVQYFKQTDTCSLKEAMQVEWTALWQALSRVLPSGQPQPQAIDHDHAYTEYGELEQDGGAEEYGHYEDGGQMLTITNTEHND